MFWTPQTCSFRIKCSVVDGNLQEKVETKLYFLPLDGDVEPCKIEPVMESFEMLLFLLVSQTVKQHLTSPSTVCTDPC